MGLMGGTEMRSVRLALWLALWGMGTCGAATVLAGPQSATERHSADRAAIEEVLQAQQAAWNRGDVTAFLEGYWKSPELTFSGSGGVARGFDGVKARYEKNYPDRAAMGELQFSDLEFQFLGPNAALVLGKWHLKREKGDIGGVFSLVWEKFPDGWKIIHDHTSAVEERK
ncbi:MAG TPA: nuclear transport factor 2 family protein [Candidatus Acidoferrales bacterium]|nr:nuclear transport factor 2 family protein [Candidatus Acidoferrales bacterium]